MEIKITKTSNPKQKPAEQDKLGFGRFYTDHMFIMNYDEGEGWHDARIVPYGPIELDPAAMCLHYGQEVFEGMKAYKTADGSVQLFRPDRNMARLNVSNERLCIPTNTKLYAGGHGNPPLRFVLVMVVPYLSRIHRTNVGEGFHALPLFQEPVGTYNPIRLNHKICFS